MPSYSVSLRRSMFGGVSVNDHLGTSATYCLYAGQLPAYADSPLGSSNILLATLAMSAVPFGTPSGVSPGDAVLLSAADLTPAPAASATGEATFFRIHGSDGSPHVQGTIGKQNADCTLNSTTIQKGAGVWIDGLILTFAP